MDGAVGYECTTIARASGSRLAETGAAGAAGEALHTATEPEGKTAMLNDETRHRLWEARGRIIIGHLDPPEWFIEALRAEYEAGASPDEALEQVLEQFVSPATPELEEKRLELVRYFVREMELDEALADGWRPEEPGNLLGQWKKAGEA